MIIKVAIFEHMAKIVYSIKLVQCGCGLHDVSMHVHSLSSVCDYE